MKTIKKTIISGTLNTTNEIKIDISLIDEIGKTLYPQEILFINNTNADLGVLYVQSDEELLERLKYPNWYNYINLDVGRSNGTLPVNLKYIFIKKLARTATGNLEFHLISYI